MLVEREPDHIVVQQDVTRTSRESDQSEITESSARLLSLFRRVIVAAVRAQARNGRSATDFELPLVDAETLPKACGSFRAQALSNPERSLHTQLHGGSRIAAAFRSLRDPSSAADLDVTGGRSSDPSWSGGSTFCVCRDVCLVSEEAANALLDRMSDDRKDQLKASFCMRRMMSALSPSSFLATIAAARRRTLESRDTCHLERLESTLDDLEHADGRIQLATGGTGAIQDGTDLATTERDVAFESQPMQLIQFAPRTEVQCSFAILFVAACIALHCVFVKRPKNGPIRLLLSRGHAVFVVSWGSATRNLSENNTSDCMVLGAVSAPNGIPEIKSAGRARAFGHCIGSIPGANNPSTGWRKSGYRTATNCPMRPNEFLESVERHEGSSWTHWAKWREPQEEPRAPTGAQQPMCKRTS